MSKICDFNYYRLPPSISVNLAVKCSIFANANTVKNSLISLQKPLYQKNDSVYILILKGEKKKKRSCRIIAAIVLYLYLFHTPVIVVYRENISAKI